MNDIAKKAASDRFLKALEAEKLSKADGGSCIDLTPAQVSYLFNEKYWGRLGNVNWDKVLMWVNSGQGLQEYSVKHGKVLAEDIKPGEVTKEKIEVNDVSDESEKTDNVQLPERAIHELKQIIDMLYKRIQTTEEKLKELLSIRPSSLNTNQKTVIDIEIRVNGKPIRLE